MYSYLLELHLEIHEKKYKELRREGYKGWGGTSFINRMNSWEEQLTRVFNLLNQRSIKVLELGSGAGDVSLSVAKRGYAVTGIDISQTAVEWARQKAIDRNLPANFYCIDVVDSNYFMGEKFDLIIDGNCLHCLFDEDRDRFFSNLERLIEVGGYAFISSAVKFSDSDIEPEISSIPRCFVTKESIIKNLEDRGFALLEDWGSNGTHEHYYGLFKYVSQ